MKTRDFKFSRENTPSPSSAKGSQICDAIEVADRLLQLPDSPSVCSAASLAELQPCLEVFCQGAWEKTLFVLDIDQTLLSPLLEEASSQAIAQHWSAFKETIPPLSVTQHELLFNAAIATEEVAPMEPEAPAFFQRLQAQGAAVIALTATLTGPLFEHPRFEAFRHKQCQALGYAFTPLLDEEDVALPFPEHNAQRPRYYKGIVFCNGAHTDYTKGDILCSFLDLLPSRSKRWPPDRVVFLDDTRRHILSVHQSLEARGLPHLCCEYTRHQAKTISVSEEAFECYWGALWRKIEAEERGKLPSE